VIFYQSIYPVFLTAVTVSRKPNTIPLCFSIDLVLDFLLSWLLVLLPSTCFLDSCDINFLHRQAATEHETFLCVGLHAPS